MKQKLQASLFFCIGAFFLINSFEYKIIENHTHVGSGFFPLIVSGVLIVLSIIIWRGKT
jgi:hypothetical protein